MRLETRAMSESVLKIGGRNGQGEAQGFAKGLHLGPAVIQPKTGSADPEQLLAATCARIMACSSAILNGDWGVHSHLLHATTVSAKLSTSFTFPANAGDLASLLSVPNALRPYNTSADRNIN